MSKVCKNCNTENKDIASFCRECGKALEKEEEKQEEKSEEEKKSKDSENNNTEYAQFFVYSVFFLLVMLLFIFNKINSNSQEEVRQNEIRQQQEEREQEQEQIRQERIRQERENFKLEQIKQQEIQQKIIFKLKLESFDKSKYFIWNGKDYQKFGNIQEIPTFKEVMTAFENHIRKSMPLKPKGEFETSLEFEKRKNENNVKIANEINKLDKEAILNSWLGKQDISMDYNADKEEFNIVINGMFNFKLQVPIKYAKYFKRDVKSINLIFKYENDKLDLIGAIKEYKNELYIKSIKNIKNVEVKLKIGWLESSSFKMGWYEAQDYCRENFVARVPTKDELLEAYKNGIDGFKKSYYWSSSSSADVSNFAWFVGFGNGSTGYYGKNSIMYVRCVR